MRLPNVWLVTGTLALATFWLARPGQQESPGRPAPAGAPGYYFNDATMDETDEQGNVNITLNTRRAVEDVPQRAVQLSDLTAAYRAAPDAVWRLRAAHGTLPLGSNVLTVRGDVELRSDAPNTAGAVVVTDELELDRAHKIATTAAPARIDWPPHQLYAQGLRMDLIRKSLALQSSVHGTFHR